MLAFRLPLMRSDRYTDDMALSRTLYNAIFKRTSTFAVTIVVSAVFFERVFDQGGDALFEHLNRGVSVLLHVFVDPDLVSGGHIISALVLA